MTDAIDREIGRLEKLAAPLEHYRPVGEEGGKYPAWFRELRGRAGVYAIKIKGERAPRWVGESTGGHRYVNPKPSRLGGGKPTKPDLYKTIARHLEQWDREGRSLKGATYDYERADSYKRDNALIAVAPLSPATAGKPLTMKQRARIWRIEERLICELRPTDNAHHAQECLNLDEVPF